MSDWSGRTGGDLLREDLRSTSGVEAAAQIAYRNLKCVLALLNGFRQIPLPGQGDTQITVGLGIVRVELERAFAVVNGFIKPPLGGQRDSDTTDPAWPAVG
jgi:hypothetical protein